MTATDPPNPLPPAAAQPQLTTSRGSGELGSRSRFGGRDPLDRHRAIVGRDARTPFLARLRALIVLIVLVMLLGAAIAGVTLLAIASGRFLLETLAG